MAEFREKAKGQIDIEELQQARKTEKPHYRDDDRTRDSKKNFKPIPRYETYTKFNTKRDDIIKEILNSKLIKPPRKAGNYPDSKGTDRSKYCSFHQKHGHNTDDCVIAKDLLERLARQDHLDKYISGHMQRGFAGGEATNSARKRSYRAILSINTDQSQQQPLPTSPQITFQTADHDNSVANLDNPVVISLQLGDLLVKKVLLDPGSSADVLFYSTIQKMKLSNNAIQPSTGDLDNTIATIHSDAREARECYNNSLKRPNRNTKAQIHNIGNMKDQHMLADLDPRAGTLERPTPIEDLEKIYFTENMDKFTYVGSTFMDAYSGYNQIQMHPSDQNKTAFITEYGNYCYKVMPFGLKNAGATYQRLMDKIFAKQIGRNIEVYVDDMVAKTKVGKNHLDDLTEIFGQLRKYNMRLNPEKCAFGVQSGKFLGFMLTSRGIEANPEKFRAILDMTSPHTIKEVQRLTGRLAALSRFLPCLASKSSCFFQTLKNKKAFQWTDECEQAFTTIKETLSKPPILQTPLQGEPLFLYLFVTNWAISSALVAEREKKQFPIYFTSKTLQNAELRYPSIEKLALALVFSARRLRPYFQSHEIHVRTDQPLRQVLQKPELAGRLVKWLVELSEFDITYEGRASIKSQFLADFIAEFSVPSTTEDHIQWSLYVDGSSNPQGCGAGIILDDGRGNVIEHSLNFSFKASNNQSEYEALIAGLRLAADLNITELKVYCDSLLIVQQVNNLYQVKDPLLSKYLDVVQNLLSKFSKYEIQHIPRESNGRANILSKLASTQPNGSLLYQSTLLKPSIELTQVLSVTQEADWRSPYIQYLQTGILPGDVENARHFRRQASFFTIYNNCLYRWGFSRPLLKCLCRKEAELALAEAHEGICGTHLEARSLYSKILRAGLYWPTIRQDCQAKVKSCNNCQKHSLIIHLPAELLYCSEVSWPFNQWGIDILGPFPTAAGQVKFLMVAIDYFSKWIEAQPLAKITSQQMLSFVWKYIICRFGIPRHIITDNGRQFADKKCTSFLQNLKIKQHFSSVEHPQTNGLAEAANKVILHALRKKLDDAKSLWAELIPEIIWGYNTTIHLTTKETPFRLIYGSDAMIHVEISQSSLRTELADQTTQDIAQQTELDLIEELRSSAAIKHLAIQQHIA
nr:uncharacterized protein LOC112756783 [Arachis hypogaea]